MHYLIDSGSPFTLFDAKALQELHKDVNRGLMNTPSYRLNIEGFEIVGSAGKDSYSELNLLGQDFLEKHKLTFIDNPAGGTCELITNLEAWAESRLKERNQ